MRVEVRLFATLCQGRFESRSFALPPRSSLRELLARTGIAAAEAPLRLVNGVSAPLDRELADRDVVSLFPALGGG